MRTVAVIDYGSGNLRSAAKATERAALETGLELTVMVTADPASVRSAERVILPGVGAFADCMAGLEAIPGMVAALYDSAIVRKRPVLGICVGLQLMASWGREHGEHAGLGWIEGETVPLAPVDDTLKVPHTGWNALIHRQPGHPLLAGIGPGAHAYFNHSYALSPVYPEEVIVAASDHGGEFAALVAVGNVAGAQFHPEKSQAVGLRLIRNFLIWNP